MSAPSDAATGATPSRPVLRLVGVAAVVATLVGGGLALADGGPAAGTTTSDGAVVTVLAAASLGEAFEELAASFEAEHPGVDVALSAGPSSTLAAQVAAGAPADVLATADERTMATALADVADAEPRVLARNVPALAVAASSDVDALTDLADVPFALCRPEVPCGAVAERLLADAGVDAEPVTYESDVTAVLTKVAWGEVDAGLVWASEVRPGAAVVRDGRVRAVALPAGLAEPVDLAVVALPAGPEPDLAAAFVEHALSDVGRRVLADAGFLLP